MLVLDFNIFTFYNQIDMVISSNFFNNNNNIDKTSYPGWELEVTKLDILTEVKSQEPIEVYERVKLDFYLWSPVCVLSSILLLMFDHALSVYLPNLVINFTSLIILIFSLLLILLCIIATALLTLKERSVLASVQLRKGPDKIFYGFLQPIADALKLILKEFVVPNKSFKYVYKNVASFGFVCSAFLLVFIPFSYSFIISNGEFNFLFIFFFNLLHVYSVLLSGWASKSKYSSLGSIRSISQLISYDIALSLIIMHVYCYTKTFSILYIVEYQSLNILLCLLIPIQAVYFLVIGAAETSRHPFDLPEAEPELVSGYNVEYSAIRFALFFLSEYLSVIIFSCVTVLVFINGWGSFLIYQNFEYAFKISVIIFVVIKLRALLPRYRADQLMRVCWKFIIPFELLNLIFSITASFINL